MHEDEGGPVSGEVNLPPRGNGPFAGWKSRLLAGSRHAVERRGIRPLPDS